METKKEDTEAITLFFSKFNEMLRRITQKMDYNFNPKNLMMDEAGANFNGVKNVLGQKFVDDKCITCQWNFMRNMNEWWNTQGCHMSSLVEECSRLFSKLMASDDVPVCSR